MEILRKIAKFFQKHPEANGMTYWEHFWHSLRLCAIFVLGGFMSLIHSVFPFWFKTCAQSTIMAGMMVIEMKNHQIASRTTHRRVVASDDTGILHLIPEGEEELHVLDPDGNCWCDPDEMGEMESGNEYWLHYPKEQTKNMKNVKERLN